MGSSILDLSSVRSLLDRKEKKIVSNSDICHEKKRTAVEWLGRCSLGGFISGSISESGTVELSLEWWSKNLNEKHFHQRVLQKQKSWGRNVWGREKQPMHLKWVQWKDEGRGAAIQRLVRWRSSHLAPCQVEELGFCFTCTGKLLGGFKLDVAWSDLCFTKKTLVPKWWMDLYYITLIIIIILIIGDESKIKENNQKLFQ